MVARPDGSRSDFGELAGATWQGANGKGMTIFGCDSQMWVKTWEPLDMVTDAPSTLARAVTLLMTRLDATPIPDTTADRMGALRCGRTYRRGRNR